MIHEMKLNPKYYNFIKNGTKRIEIRLNDEKRQKLKVGDKIKFINEQNKEKSFLVTIIKLTKYNSLEKLINNNKIETLADKQITKEELTKDIEKFYTKEKQQKYGMLEIKFKLTN